MLGMADVSQRFPKTIRGAGRTELASKVSMFYKLLTLESLQLALPDFFLTVSQVLVSSLETAKAFQNRSHKECQVRAGKSCITVSFLF